MILFEVNSYGFSIEGHAPKSDNDRINKICTAVSAMAQMAVIGIKEVAGVELEHESQPHEHGGELYICWRDKLNTEAAAILDTFVMSMQSLADTYGGTIRISDAR